MATPTQFVSLAGLEPWANLYIGSEVYKGFSVIEHGELAEETERRIRQFKGIADCRPPLQDNSLSFRRLPTNFSMAFTDPNTIERMQSDTDQVKEIFKGFGLLAQRCLREGVKLDFNLRNIYIGDVPPFLIKGVVLQKDAEIEFEDWKSCVIKVYREVLDLIMISPNDDYELKVFLNQLTTAGNPKEFESRFDTWIFWSTRKRMAVIRKIAPMLRNIGVLKFSDYCNVSKLRDWRQRMLFDATIAPLVRSLASVNDIPATSIHWVKNEIDILLVFIRLCFAHFDRTEGFESEYELAKHLNTQFPHIMGAVYEGCIQVDCRTDFSFEFDSM